MWALNSMGPEISPDFHLEPVALVTVIDYEWSTNFDELKTGYNGYL